MVKSVGRLPNGRVADRSILAILSWRRTGGCRDPGALADDNGAGAPGHGMNISVVNETMPERVSNCH